MKSLKQSGMTSTMNPTRLRLLARLEIDKRRALNDLYFFDRNVLGYRRMVPHVHEKLCKFTTHEIPHGAGEQTTKLILMPRGSFKSVCITIGYTLWRLARNPNLTVLITNEKLEKSKAFMREIKGHIQDNKRFNLLFGNWSCDKARGRKWTEEKIDIYPRKITSAAPSIEVSSVESSETGKHVDLIIADDLIGQSNFNSKEQLDKVYQYYRDLGSVLKPDGEIVIVGTKWDERDLYARVQQLKKDLGALSNIEILIESAEREDGTLLFPEELSRQFLISQRKKQGPYFFGCQYNNIVVSREDAMIKTVLKYSSEIDGMSAEKFFAHCNTFVTVDLAYTENDTSDSTAIVVNSVNPLDGKWYIRHYEVFKTQEPDKIVERLFEIDKQFKPIRFGIEKNNYISWLKNPLENAMRERKHFLNIDPPDGLGHYGKNQNKAMRLRGLAPVFNFGNALISNDMLDLEDELSTLTYDGARGKDDLLDALAMQSEIVSWGNAAPANKYDNESSIELDPQVGFTKWWNDRFGGQEKVSNGWYYA